MCVCAVCAICLFVLNSLYPSQTGWSALLGAVYMEHDEIVLTLLEAGARPDIQDKVYCIVAKHYTSVAVSSKNDYALRHVYKCFWVIVRNFIFNRIKRVL